MSQETWKPIPGLPGYEASDQGRIRSFRRDPAGKILRPAKVGRGYLMVAPCVDGKNKPCRVHHLVLAAFVGPRPLGLVGCHKNDIPDDNRPSNLRWGTNESNVADRVARGPYHGGYKLKPEDVAKIVADPRSHQEIALAFGVHRRSIRDIKTGDTWKHVPGARVPFGAYDRRAKLRPEQIREIRADTRARKVIADGYGVSPSCIKKIQRRDRWQHI